jgi:hypothetical protein
MDQQMYVLDARLVGHEHVRRVIGVRADRTLVDLHYALQSAFGWDDDHLYAFWPQGGFWSDDPYVHPAHAPAATGAGRSACERIGELGLRPGRRLSYVFDFAREWRVELTVRSIEADHERRSPRLLDSEGVAPPQYAISVTRGALV